MVQGKAAVKVAATPEEVWAVVGDFGGLQRWLDGVEACEVDGDVRKIRTMGLDIHERLVERDEQARRISYSVVQSPMELDHHLATITVDADGDGSLVTWAYEVEPDEMGPAFGPIYERSVGLVEAHFRP